MPDREKYIEVFKQDNKKVKESNENTPIKISLECIEDILELLKEEAVEPICQIIFDVPYYFCGSCKNMLNMYATKAKYCSKCGKAVKWE